METMTDREQRVDQIRRSRSPCSEPGFQAHLDGRPGRGGRQARPRSTSTSTTAPTCSAKLCRSSSSRRPMPHWRRSGRRPRRRAHRRLSQRLVADGYETLYGMAFGIEFLEAKHEFAADVFDAEPERGRDGLRVHRQPDAGQSRHPQGRRRARAPLPPASKSTGHSPRSTANDSTLATAAALLLDTDLRSSRSEDDGQRFEPEDEVAAALGALFLRADKTDVGHPVEHLFEQHQSSRRASSRGQLWRPFAPKAWCLLGRRAPNSWVGAEQLFVTAPDK